MIVTPHITVVKTAGNAPDGTTLYTNGGNVTYTYLVTNDGDVDLANVKLDDNKLGSIDCPKSFLPVDDGETNDHMMTCTASGPVNVDTTNIATVTGETPHATVSDFDDAVVLVRHASITKTNDTEGKVAPGTTVGYELTLTVVNGPIPTMTVADVLPANFGTPSAHLRRRHLRRGQPDDHVDPGRRGHRQDTDLRRRHRDGDAGRQLPQHRHHHRRPVHPG